jgi:hypothetical protein
MARDIDRVLDFIRLESAIPPIHRLVLIKRCEVPPTPEELEAARTELYDALLGSAEASSARQEAGGTALPIAPLWCVDEGERVSDPGSCQLRDHQLRTYHG